MYYPHITLYLQHTIFQLFLLIMLITYIYPIINVLFIIQYHSQLFILKSHITLINITLNVSYTITQMHYILMVYAYIMSNPIILNPYHSSMIPSSKMSRPLIPSLSIPTIISQIYYSSITHNSMYHHSIIYYIPHSHITTFIMDLYSILIQVHLSYFPLLTYSRILFYNLVELMIHVNPILSLELLVVSMIPNPLFTLLPNSPRIPRIYPSDAQPHTSFMDL